jgi:hypothetical protein
MEAVEDEYINRNFDLKPEKKRRKRVKPPYTPVEDGNKLWFAMMDSNNAYHRSKGVGFYLAQLLKRPPTADEIDEEYERRNLGTGPNNPNRYKRHQRAADRVAMSFDSKKVKKNRRVYEVGQYLELLSQFVTQEDLEFAARATKYRGKITLADLDVGLGFHVVQNLQTHYKKEYEGTVPVDGMIAWFRALKAKKKITRSCDYGKVRAIREALQIAGLIELVDEEYNWTFNNKGVAQKWGLGEKCPEYKQYLKVNVNSSVCATLNKERVLSRRCESDDEKMDVIEQMERFYEAETEFLEEQKNSDPYCPYMWQMFLIKIGYKEEDEVGSWLKV